MQRYNQTIKTGIATTEAGKRYFTTVQYPEIPVSHMDTIVYAKETDFLDTLADKYYSDKTLWWIIAKANNIVGRWSVPPGTKLRIPHNKMTILASFNRLNSNK